MVLVTAIANPKRLKPYLPKDLVALYMYEDHYAFTKSELDEIIAKHNATSLLVTSKDAVKLEGFGLPLSMLVLELKIDNQIHEALKKYLNIPQKA
jgi:tetraacyldisaccharide 4'-kinase